MLSIWIAGAAHGLTKGEVVERLVKVYGGEQNLEKLSSLHQYWNIIVLHSNTEGSDYRKILLPNHLYVELNYPGRSESRLLSGNSAFRASDGSGFRSANEMQADAQRLQLMRLYSPLTLLLKLEELEFTDGEEFCILSLKDASLRVDYLVYKATWRIEKVAGTMIMGQGKMEFLTEYSDFRMNDGVLMHYRENKYAGSVNTARLELLRVEFDPALRPGDFPAPGAAEGYLSP
jgi:hypothetical protein